MQQILASFSRILTLRALLLYLALGIGVLILSPNIDLQLWLSTGDHGLNLYGAEAVLRGEKPYRDFTWFYGPAMLYYYGLFFKLFGVKISSVLLGKAVLDLLTGLLIYLSLSRFISPVISLVACSWFWIFSTGILYTYNHAGGMTLLALLIFLALQYTLTPKRQIIYTGLAISVLLSLVKLNVGVLNLAGFMLSITLTDRLMFSSENKNPVSFYIKCLASALGCIIIAYSLFLFDSPRYVLDQFFNLFNNDAGKHYGLDLNEKLRIFLTVTATDIAGNWPNTILSGITLLSIMVIIYRMIRRTDTTRETISTWAIFAILFLFLTVNLHEFLLSGLLYRRSWVEAPQVLLTFWIIGSAGKFLPKVFRAALYASFLLFLFAGMVPNELAAVKEFKKMYAKLDLAKANIYICNDPSWHKTVYDTTVFLKKNVNPGEQLLILPYDPLYYFLTGHKSPLRELAVFKYLGIVEDQELRMIETLKEKNVEWVIFSNRALSDDPILGRFGDDYCPLLSQYIQANYKQVITFGNFTANSGWIENHAMKIFKK